MIQAYLIGRDFQTKDVVFLTNGFAEIDVYQALNFEIDFLRDVAEIGDFVTIFDGSIPKFTGVIEKITKTSKITISGSNIKKILSGIQFFVTNNVSPVDRISINSNVSSIIDEQIRKCFPTVEVTFFSSLMGMYTFSTDLRMKSIFDLLHSATSSNDLNYQMFLLGNNKMHVYINENRHIENEIKLITNITHALVEEIKNVRESYNQIVGLGAGEENERDYYFIDDSDGEIPKCYVYDVRENIEHAELVRRTNEKYATLTRDHSATFRILKNNIYDFGTDYTVGDYVGFANDEGLVFDDLISTIKINIVDGLMSQDYEVTIGRFRGTLTDKINELKEGGVK